MLRRLALIALGLAALVSLRRTLAQETAPSCCGAPFPVNGVASVTSKDLRPVEVPGAEVVPNVPGPVKYKDASLSATERAADLVSRMSLDEKVSELSNAAAAIPRLDVPAYDYWNECLHGVARAGVATVFPEPIGMAASWDPALLHDVADAISTEARAKYADAQLHNDRSIYHGLTFWTPNINIFRDPRWGRGQETYGEDPFLTSQCGVAFIKGLQGDDPRYLKVVATAKHFAVHSGPESVRHVFNAVPTARDLHETYLPQFEAAVREGHVQSVMGAYNALNGEPCCSNPWLLTETLRKSWGFDGYVVSDCGAIDDIWLHHHTVLFKTQAAARAVQAGCDLECGYDYASLVQAVNAQLIQQSQLDLSLTRVLASRFKLGLFDPADAVPWTAITPDQNCTPAAAALAKKTADESITLLKNEYHALPLDRGKLHKVALVGPNLDTWAAFYGNYNGNAMSAPTLLEALRAKLGAARIIPVRGVPYADSPGDLEVLPDVCLQHGGVNGPEGGLAAEYFTNPDLLGAPSITRTDYSIDFCYRDAPLLANYPLRDTSARWTGRFVAPVDGDFTLAVDTAERVRLWLGGTLVVNQWHEGDRTPQRASVSLKKGQSTDLRLEYGRGSSDFARLTLFWNRRDLDLTPMVVDRVKDADVILFAGGINGDIEGEEGERRRPLVNFRGGDRQAIELPAVQDHLLQTLASTGKPVILINFSGSAMAMGWEAEHLPAILQAWYPGEAGGAAVVDALLGETNPAGRLPVTFYAATTDLPRFDDYSMKNRTYRFFTGKPLWAFGHGLSYSTFEYRDATVATSSVTPDQTVNVTLDVANTSGVDGQDVVQLYSHRRQVIAGDAARDLRAFQRIFVGKGDTKRVMLSFPAASLRRWDEKRNDFVVDPGDYQLQIGPGSDRLPITLLIRIAAKTVR